MASMNFDVPTIIINLAKDHVKMKQMKELMCALNATRVTWLAAVHGQDLKTRKAAWTKVQNSLHKVLGLRNRFQYHGRAHLL